MKELHKDKLIQINKTLEELFKNLPRIKDSFKHLQNQLTNSCEKVFKLNDSIKDSHETFKDSLILLEKEKELLIEEANQNYLDKTNSISENFYNQSQTLIKELTNQQEEIVLDFKNIQEKTKHYHTSINDQVYKLKIRNEEEKLDLKNDVDEQSIHFQSRINSIYRFKESEALRINNKFHEAIKDYHQKNKQRLTQNTIRLTEVSSKLDDYTKFHEKDAIYSKQNYLRSLSNLNEKIYQVSQTYRINEENLEKKISLVNDSFYEHLQKQKDILFELNEEALVDYEQAYKQIDEDLDRSRKEFQLLEDELEKNYHREVTKINVDYHNRKELIDNRIQFIINEQDNNNKKQKELKDLKRKIKQLQFFTDRKLQKAKRDYSRKLLNVAKIHVRNYETISHKRTIIEQVKNDTLEINQELFSIEESLTNELQKLNQEINQTKLQILNNYKLLEIVPLETQATLSSHIYDLEINYQNLETNHINYISEREKELINLKSELHEHNLNKIKDRVTLTYESELDMSNMTTYLQMESEKNELVHLKRLLVLKKKHNDARYAKSILKLQQKQERYDFYRSYDKEKLNITLKYKTNLKKLKDNRLFELNNYSLISNERSYKNQLNTINSINVIEGILKEGVLIEKLLNIQYDILKSLFDDENLIYETLRKETSTNTNHDDFLLMLNTTTSLLKTKQQSITVTLEKFIDFFKIHLEEKLEVFKVKKYNEELEKINQEYYKKESILSNNKTQLEENYESSLYVVESLTTNVEKTQSELDLAFGTIKYSKKELKKKNLSLKAQQSFKDIIEMHEKLIIANNSELITLKNKIKEKSIPLKSLKNEIKTINQDLAILEREKNRSLRKLTRAINKNTLVYEKNLSYLNSFKNHVISIDNSYNDFLNSLGEENIHIPRLLLLINKQLLFKQRNLGRFFTEGIVTSQLEYSINVKQNTKIQANTLKHFNKETFLLKRKHENKIESISKEIENLNKDYNRSFVLLDKKYRVELNDILNEQELNRKDASIAISTMRQEIKEADDLHKKLGVAAEINKNELVITNKDKLKNNLKLSLTTNNKKIKEYKQQIKRLELDINHEIKQHEAKLNYFSTNDKQKRKRINNEHNNEQNKLLKDIEKLKLRIPILENDTKTLKLRSLDKKIKKEKDFNPLGKFDSFKNRLSLYFYIRKKTKQFQHELLKKL